MQGVQQAAIGVVEPGDIVAAAAEGVAVITEFDETDGLAAFHADAAVEAFWIVAGDTERAERGGDRFGPQAEAFRPCQARRIEFQYRHGGCPLTMAE